MDQDAHDQDDALDGVVDQGVHLERNDDLVDDGIGHGPEQDAEDASTAAAHADAAEHGRRDGIHLSLIHI